MFKRLLPAALIGYLFLVIVNWGCTKLDTTTLGTDLIPAVDNVNTFRDSFPMVSSQHLFDDTFKITSAAINVLGTITDDPLIGGTQAHMFFQFKPLSYPYYFGSNGDSATVVDSVVLCLNYVGFWGDSSKPQKLQVYEIDQKGFVDSPTFYRTIKYQPNLKPDPISPEYTFDVRSLSRDTLRLYEDSVISQIRLKLNNDFAQRLFAMDSTSLPLKNAFYSDSVFRKFYNGFAVKSTGGGSNGLMYINLQGATSRLEVYYKKKLANSTVIDTTRSTFTIINSGTTSNLVSASSNYINRAWGSNILNPAGTDLHMVTGPGTYATLSIPVLTTLTNRIVHRAEIYMEENPDNITNDSIFSAPSFMYLDLVDTGATKWKSLYFDLSPNESYDPDNRTAFLSYYPQAGGVDYNYFGGVARTRINYLGQKVKYYTINITRHVQRIITHPGTAPNYEMRLFPAYSFSYPQHTGGISTYIMYDNPLARGRVRLKGAGHNDSKTRMQLIMTWSKIN